MRAMLQYGMVWYWYGMVLDSVRFLSGQGAKIYAGIVDGV